MGNKNSAADAQSVPSLSLAGERASPRNRTRALLLTAITLTAAAALIATTKAFVEQAPVCVPVLQAGTSEHATSPAEKPSGQGLVDPQGDALPVGAVARLGSLRFRNGDRFSSLAFTPDGRLLISGSDGSAAQLWDVATGKVVMTFPGGQAQPWGRAVLSPDGKLVAAGGWDKDMGGAVFELSTGRRLYRYGRPSNSARPACFSPDGKILAVHYGWVIDLFDAPTGRLLRSFGNSAKERQEIVDLAFARDGKTLVSAAQDAPIRFWNVAMGTEIRNIPLGQGGAALLALSPDNSRIAVVEYIKEQLGAQTMHYGDTRVQVLDYLSGRKQVEFDARGGEVQGRPFGPRLLAFTPDGKQLLTGGQDGLLRTWDFTTGKELRRFPRFAGYLTAVAFAPDGKTFAMAESGATLHVCDLATGRDLNRLGAGHHAAIKAIDFAFDGKMLATAAEDGGFCLWDVPTGQLLRQWSTPLWGVFKVRFAARGKVLFVGDYNGEVCMWETGSGRELGRISPAKSRAEVVASPDGKTTAVIREKTVFLFNAATGQEQKRFSTPDEFPTTAAFSLDGRTLFTIGIKNLLNEWDLATGHLTRSQGIGDTENYGWWVMQSQRAISCLLWTSRRKPSSHSSRVIGLTSLKAA